jgi:hypothetical protein
VNTRPADRGSRPVPLERGRAGGVLIGLVLFTAGFAAAGLIVLGGAGGSPGYLVAITVGLVGIGVSGFFLNRGTVELPSSKLWTPTALRAFVAPLALPPTPVLATLYVLAAIGVVGNLVVPLVLRR